MKNFKEIKNKIVKSLLERNLKDPNIRINALNKIEEILTNNFEEKDIYDFKNIDKKALKERIAKFKQNGKLNGAENSIINEIYKFI